MKIADLDRFAEKLESRGAATFEDRHYKLVLLGSEDQPAVERVIKGDRQTIVGSRSVPFGSLDAARLWAIDDARSSACADLDPHDEDEDPAAFDDYHDITI